MNIEWIKKLANDIEVRHGKEARDKIIGDIDGFVSSPESLSAWFANFTTGLDELNDKEFLQQMMVKHCPCGGGDEERGALYKELYNKSKNLQEFVKLLNDNDAMGDILELRGNVLYITKYLVDNEDDCGSCGKACHCYLAKYTNKVISDIFCYCCTIAHTGRPFQCAFGHDVKMEFIESVIGGGKGCTMTVHLPEKKTTDTSKYTDVELCNHGFNMYCEMFAAPTGYWLTHCENYSYVTRNELSSTTVVYNVNVKDNHHEVAHSLAQLFESQKVSNHLELARDDIFFEALKENGFTMELSHQMMIMDITDYISYFSHDAGTSISVVQNCDDLRHWIAVNEYGWLYSEQEWTEINSLDNVTMYLAWYDGVPVSAMLTISDGSACIELINTLPDYRQKGLATAMIKVALSDLKNKGISKVTVQTDATKLFEGIGFSVVCDKYVAKYKE